MVVFTCQHCGESLQKPKVEKHYQTRCRHNIPNLTCVDCFKDFSDLEYKAHTQCITEQERYSAEGTVFKGNKGRKKQAKYTEMIQNLLNSNNLTNIQRKLLDVCSKSENVPRKQKKFHNFLRSAASGVKRTPEEEISVFHLIEEAWKKEQSLVDTTDKANPNKIKDTSEPKKESEQSDVDNEENTSTNITPKSNKKKNKNHCEANGDVPVEEQMQMDTNENPKDGEENLNYISKKELKKQKKREKYLAELENNSNEKVKEQIDQEEGTEDGHKKKKRKKQAHNKGINNIESTVSMEVASEENNSKKRKKRKLGDTSSDVVDKKQKTEEMEVDGETEAAGLFDWTDTIIRVLQTRSDKELSLKRLGKKVIDEYQTLRTDHPTYEELIVKFNKKVKKVRGVRVLKDKAKLIE